jgi:hypothetical protein
MFDGFRSHRSIIYPMLAAAAVVATSCSKEPSDLLKVYPARGQVFVNGKPAEKAEVFFFSTSAEHPRTGASQAEVDKDGWYTLSTYKDKDGAPEGTYIVTVVWPDGPKPPEEGFQRKQTPKPMDRLGGRYATREESTLRRTIPHGGGEIEAIRIEQ